MAAKRPCYARMYAGKTGSCTHSDPSWHLPCTTTSTFVLLQIFNDPQERKYASIHRLKNVGKTRSPPGPNVQVKVSSCSFSSHSLAIFYPSLSALTLSSTYARCVRVRACVSGQSFGDIGCIFQRPSFYSPFLSLSFSSSPSSVDSGESSR